MLETSIYRRVHSELLYLGGRSPEHIELVLDTRDRNYLLLLHKAISYREPLEQCHLLLAIWNYYQRLITPPIVAARQYALDAFLCHTNDIDMLCGNGEQVVNLSTEPSIAPLLTTRLVRALPGLGKVTGRTRVRFGVLDHGELDRTDSRRLQAFVRQPIADVSVSLGEIAKA